MPRIYIYDGMLYQSANPADGTALEGLEGYNPSEFETVLLFQVYDENGRAPKRGASYQGQASC